MLKKLKYVITFIMLFLFLISVFYVVYVRITDEVPELFGYSAARMYTEDMEPVIDIGEVIIIKDVQPDVLMLGDVITYKGDGAVFEDRYVTHQISKEPYEVDGVYYFTTRGLKADAVNDPEINDSQLRGKVVYRVPFIGTVYDFFTEWYGIASVILLVIVLYGNDVINFIRNFKKIESNYLEDNHVNVNDIRRSESLGFDREKEFEDILTNLDDTN